MHSKVSGDNYIWLEGAEVSRTTYAKVFEVYGTTYGEGDGETTFNLPDFRNRTLWGTNEAGGFGYIEAGLPNITGFYGMGHGVSGAQMFCDGAIHNSNRWEGAFEKDTSGTSIAVASYGAGAFTGLNGASFDASRVSTIYNNDVTTVQPPSVKVRFKTRYK